MTCSYYNDIIVTLLMLWSTLEHDIFGECRGDGCRIVKRRSDQSSKHQADHVDGRQVYRAVSDEEGKFELVIPKGKTVFVQASRIGYATVTSTAAQHNDRGTDRDQREPESTGDSFERRGVVARKPVEPRLRPSMDRASLYKRAGFGRILTRTDLETRPGALVFHLLRTIPQRPATDCVGEAVFIDDLPTETDDIDLLVAGKGNVVTS